MTAELANMKRPPLVLWPSLLLHNTTSPPAVVIDLLVATEISPLDFSNTSPDTPPAVVLRLPLTFRVPPKALMGPAMAMSYKDTALVLVVLPTVKPPKVLPKVQPDVEKAPVKPVPTDSMRKSPAPVNDELAVVGALLDNTKRPALTVVAPV